MINDEIYFVVAPVRSGSTLLRLMLDNHPSITNRGEFDFLIDKIDIDNNYPNINDYHESLNNNRIFIDKNLEINKDLNYEDLISYFIKQLKTNHILSLNFHYNFEHLHKLFPNAKYIHLIRDPRDVSLSCIGMGWGGHVYCTVDIWMKAEKSWEKLLECLSADKYIEIYYEQLIEDPESTLKTICKFMSVSYSSKMIEYDESSTYSKPDRTLINQWKSRLNREELAYIEYKLGAFLQLRNYESSGFNPKKPRLIKLAIIKLKNYYIAQMYRFSKYGFFFSIEQSLANKSQFRSWKRSTSARKNRIDRLNLK